MSIDNANLTPALMQQLYKNVLIDLTAPPQKKKKDSNTDSTPFLGANMQNITVVVNEGNDVFLPEKDMTLLTSIIGACDLSMADIAIVNFAKNKLLDYDKMITQFKPQCCVLFGVSPSDLNFPFQFPMYQLQKYDTRSFLYSAPLSEVAKDVEQKKKLWNCLQKYFFNH